jgi:hypothetical protein
MKVFRLTVNGKSCVMEDCTDLLDDISLILNEGETQPITIQIVEMTEEEFEALEEFDGF